MNGIIYKFTIKINKRFYVGQHSGNKFESYWGSGRIWNNFLSSLQEKYPTCWKQLVKREILWQGECNQKTLDKLEEIYIRREHAHYSEKLGGCNVLLGTANKFGSGSPMKQVEVAKKQGNTLKKLYKENPELMEAIQKKRRWKLQNTDYKQKISRTLMGRYSGDKNPNYGNHWTIEQKRSLSEKMVGRYDGEKNPNYGNHWTDEQKKAMSEKLISMHRTNPMTGKVRITNGIINKVISKDSPLPDGWRYGMKPRKK